VSTHTAPPPAVLTLDAETELFFTMDDGDRKDNTGDVLVSVIRQVDLPADVAK